MREGDIKCRLLGGCYINILESFHLFASLRGTSCRHFSAPIMDTRMNNSLRLSPFVRNHCTIGERARVMSSLAVWCWGSIVGRMDRWMLPPLLASVRARVLLVRPTAPAARRVIRGTQLSLFWATSLARGRTTTTRPIGRSSV